MVRAVVFFVILAAVALFASANWGAFVAPTTLDLGLATVHAPLGLIMLGLLVFVTLLFAIWVIAMQAATLAESRRLTRDLQAQRDLADKAEASRFTDLRADLMARLDRLQNESRIVSEQSANAVAAHLGELEDRLVRGRLLAARDGAALPPPVL